MGLKLYSVQEGNYGIVKGACCGHTTPQKKHQKKHKNKTKNTFCQNGYVGKFGILSVHYPKVLFVSTFTKTLK